MFLVLILIKRILYPFRSTKSLRNGQIRTLLNGQAPNNIRKEAPTFVPVSIREQVAIKDSIKRIEVQTPSNVVKDILMPSVNHFNQTRIVEKILPTTKRNEDFKHCDHFRFGLRKTRFSMHLIRVKRRKLKKHMLRKWRKKFMSSILNRAKTREIRKEKNFRAELLAEIRKAENFNAEKYVDGVLRTIERVPKEDEQPLKRVFDMIRKYRFEQSMVKPDFDDPVPKDLFDKLKKK